MADVLTFCAGRFRGFSGIHVTSHVQHRLLHVRYYLHEVFAVESECGTSSWWPGAPLGVAAGAAEPAKAAPGPRPGRGWVPWAAGHSGEVFWRAGGAGSPELATRKRP